MQEFFTRKLKILVAPLDWGLGHTTRCIPIIYELRSAGIEVLLAGNATQKALLEKEFPDCKFLHLDGYNISYSATRDGFSRKILKQIPTILSAIKKENSWLKEMIEKHNIDAVISDNRFGLHSTKVPCIFITHQLLIKTGRGKFAESILQQFNYKQISRFSKCWVPDFSDEPNLAGELSHPEKKPSIPVEYIGALTRIKKLPVETSEGHLLVMLSGPEPQRTIFEKIIFDQLKNFEGSATVVRGRPAAKNAPPQIKGVTIFNHLGKDELNRELCRAEYLVCRTGYSSVMDIANLNIKPILIPTPGQTEQEYLAKHLAEQGFCITSSHQNLSLPALLEQAKTFQFQNPFSQKKYNLRAVVQKFIEEIVNGKI